MSIEAENIEHDVSVETLLKELILEIKILIKHNEHLNDEIFTEKDITS